MEITQEQFDQAVVNVTGAGDWDIIKQGLANDIYQIQAGALDAKTWEEVCEAKGFARALAYIINLRDNVTRANAAEAANAHL